MSLNASVARRIRLQHLYRNSPTGILVVPLDHPMSTGPITSDGNLDRLVGAIADSGADAVVLHKGAVRRIRAERFRDVALIIHLSAGTAIGPDPDAKYLVATVEEALRLGADAVSVHVNAGSATEARQIGDLARTAEACDRWGIPLLAMVYCRGPAIRDGRAPSLVARAAAVATELGADLVKTALPVAPEAMAEVLGACPVPILAAGGPATTGLDAILRHLAAAVRAGAGGIAAGRVVFTAPDPAGVVRRLATLVHDRVSSAPVPAVPQ